MTVDKGIDGNSHLLKMHFCTFLDFEIFILTLYYNLPIVSIGKLRTSINYNGNLINAVELILDISV